MKPKKPPKFVWLLITLGLLACSFLVPTEPTNAEYGVMFLWTDRLNVDHTRIWIDPVVEEWEMEFEKYTLPPINITGDIITVAFAGKPRGTVVVLVLHFPCGENGKTSICGMTAQIDDSGNKTNYAVDVVTDLITENQKGYFTQDGEFEKVVVPLECKQHDETSSDGVMHLIVSVCLTNDDFELPELAPQFEELKPDL